MSRKAKRHYPPAYYRYKKEHPTIALVLTTELKNVLDSYKGKLSYTEAIKKLLGDRKDFMKVHASELAYWKKAHFEVPCIKCGKPILIHQDDSLWPNFFRLTLDDYRGFHHDVCEPRSAGYQPPTAAELWELDEKEIAQERSRTTTPRQK